MSTNSSISPPNYDIPTSQRQPLIPSLEADDDLTFGGSSAAQPRPQTAGGAGNGKSSAQLLYASYMGSRTGSEKREPPTPSRSPRPVTASGPPQSGQASWSGFLSLSRQTNHSTSPSPRPESAELADVLPSSKYSTRAAPQRVGGPRPSTASGAYHHQSVEAPGQPHGHPSRGQTFPTASLPASDGHARSYHNHHRAETAPPSDRERRAAYSVASAPPTSGGSSNINRAPYDNQPPQFPTAAPYGPPQPSYPPQSPHISSLAPSPAPVPPSTYAQAPYPPPSQYSSPPLSPPLRSPPNAGPSQGAYHQQSHLQAPPPSEQTSRSAKRSSMSPFVKDAVKGLASTVGRTVLNAALPGVGDMLGGAIDGIAGAAGGGLLGAGLGGTDLSAFGGGDISSLANSFAGLSTGDPLSAYGLGGGGFGSGGFGTNPWQNYQQLMAGQSAQPSFPSLISQSFTQQMLQIAQNSQAEQQAIQQQFMALANQGNQHAGYLTPQHMLLLQAQAAEHARRRAEIVQATNYDWVKNAV